MLNGFCRKGFPLSLEDSTTKIENEIISRIREYRRNNFPFLFICDSHTMNDPEIHNPYPPHCLEGTIEAKIIDKLLPFSSEENIVRKNTLSIFFNTDLDERLSKESIEEIEIVGVCSDICVHYAAYECTIRGFKTIINDQGTLPLFYNQEREIHRMKKILNVSTVKECPMPNNT